MITEEQPTTINKKNTAGKPAAFSISKINQIHSKY